MIKNKKVTNMCNKRLSILERNKNIIITFESDCSTEWISIDNMIKGAYVELEYGKVEELMHILMKD